MLALMCHQLVQGVSSPAWFHVKKRWPAIMTYNEGRLASAFEEAMRSDDTATGISDLKSADQKQLLAVAWAAKCAKLHKVKMSDGYEAFRAKAGGDSCFWGRARDHPQPAEPISSGNPPVATGDGLAAAVSGIVPPPPAMPQADADTPASPAPEPEGFSATARAAASDAPALPLLSVTGTLGVWPLVCEYVNVISDSLLAMTLRVCSTSKSMLVANSCEHL